MTRSALSVTNKSAILSDNCGEIVSVWHDQDNDGRPDFYYYQRSTRTDDGYYLSTDTNAEFGAIRTINFYYAPAYTPYLDYIPFLDEFTDPVSQEQFSFFPSELLISEAKLIYAGEQEFADRAYQVIEAENRALKSDYVQAHLNSNHDQRMEVKDNVGRRIENPEYNLGAGAGGSETIFDNSYDLRGYGGV